MEPLSGTYKNRAQGTICSRLLDIRQNQLTLRRLLGDMKQTLTLRQSNSQMGLLKKLQ
jgi:hypothetical protein